MNKCSKTSGTSWHQVGERRHLRILCLKSLFSTEGNAMDTSDVYTQIFQSLMPLIQIAIVLWAAETLLTMFIKEHRKSKKKKEREKRRLDYQDRRMANDEEHAKVTRAMRYDVLRRDDFRCVKCGRGREDGVKLHVDHIKPVSRGKVRNEQPADTLRGLQLWEGETNTRSSVFATKIERAGHHCRVPPSILLSVQPSKYPSHR